MSGGGLLPYLDVPFQHASPKVLKAMRRPGNQEKTLERIRAWRAIAAGPDDPLDLHRRLSRRDGGGFPAAARLARRGQARPRRRLQIRAGAAARAPTISGSNPCPTRSRQSRWRGSWRRQSAISLAKQKAKIGRRLDVLIDEGGPSGGKGRTQGRRPGDRRRRPCRLAPPAASRRHRQASKSSGADAYDLWGDGGGVKHETGVAKSPKSTPFSRRTDPGRGDASVARDRRWKCGLREEIKWGQPCYTADGKNIVLIHAFKDYCALLFMKGALMKDPTTAHPADRQRAAPAGRSALPASRTSSPRRARLKAYVEEAVAGREGGAEGRKEDRTPTIRCPEEFRAKA